MAAPRRRSSQDEGNPKGLDRGNIRPINILGQQFISPLDAEFLMDLKGSFLGSNPDPIYENIPDSWRGNAPYHAELAYEQQNLHRSAGANFERLLTYLRFPGFTLADFGEVILPSSSGSGGPSAMEKFDAICADARDDAFKNCINLFTVPIAAVAREAVCLKDWAVCAAGATAQCAKKLCDVTCHSGIGFNYPCSHMIAAKSAILAELVADRTECSEQANPKKAIAKLVQLALSLDKGGRATVTGKAQFSLESEGVVHEGHLDLQGSAEKQAGSDR